ncbi:MULTISPECIES: type 1 glutamine amidotransferase [unclassified Lactobacillus]|uniref:type 1 glutamine amidotransferase n=1 Tax=unclassified Lactobacillus TaxID=2620435 RepID=UPI00226AB5C1|nr:MULTISPECIES: type 1 glutamine amidotransferase [unclassified Lactobacillus]MCX8720258.1 type 1 glutamine amidotransferase [Lactobacillus sp. B4010]MCX8732923.1 type 1 glutamine amidotransferase [Lactobacillus sp. B4015]MCX8735024.1 type 1 glutamine amidotransferase [Lactobacillus sp. B4012]
MIVNVLQHTPNEGPGSIQKWAHLHHHEFYVYHPYQFGILPTAEETDFLVILGGPMSPNDDLPWIKQERQLIKKLLTKNVPILGICYGAQQIVKTLGYQVKKAPVKEVGWGPVTVQTDVIKGLPHELTVLHWHEEMFEIPQEAKVLFSNDNLQNQGFVLGKLAVGLQFHLEPEEDNLKEIVVNDAQYISGSVFQQTAEQIISAPIPPANEAAMFSILDYLA